MSGRVDRIFATETVESGSIPGQVESKTKLVFTAFLFDVLLPLECGINFRRLLGFSKPPAAEGKGFGYGLVVQSLRIIA